MAAIISPPEQKIIMQGVSWATYEQLLADFVDSHAAHFAFDSGTLEIMSPSPKHEKPNRTIAMLIELVAGEMEVDIENLGSTTFKREDIAKGFEPDSCFYVAHAELARRKDEIDLMIDPPPDLVIEIDITHPSLDKFPIFAAFGVPEVWRYDGVRVRFYTLIDRQYAAQTTSLIFPSLTAAAVTELLEASKSMKRNLWLGRVREWARTQR
ncbi:MAG: Uma2 family endonuclease [Acidobacteriota bacterium]|nr:Uma2 family endonuclease [Acidobacteriota bacterium]